MVRKYIRKLREKAAKAERDTNMDNAGNKKGRDEKTMGNLNTGSVMIADTIAKLQDDEPPDLEGSDGGTELVTFVKFCDLPQELRLAIWKKALPGPRILRINGPDSLIRKVVLAQKDNDDGTSELSGSSKHGMVFSTTDTNIGMLKACRESRYVAVKAYPVHLPAKDNSKEIRVGSDDVVMIGDIDRLLKMVKEETDSYPAAFAKFKVLEGVHTLAFVAVAEEYNASIHRISRQLSAILTSRLVFMPLFPNVTSIKLICDHTDSTRDGILEGFVANKAEEYDEERSELVWGAKDQQSFYEYLREIWKNQHNVSFPPLEVLVTKEYL